MEKGVTHMSGLVLVEVHGNRGELVLNRPERRNSLTGPLVCDLKRGLEELDGNPEIKAIVIRGAKGYFCAGLDLKEFSKDPQPDWVAGFPEQWLSLHCAIWECNKPIFGALEGFAIAGGSSLALACDFLVIGRGAFFHVAEAERGMQAPINTAWLQLRYGYAKAQSMTLLAQRYYGNDLVQQGMALESVEDAAVLERTREVANRLATFDDRNLAALKSGVRRALGDISFRRLVENVRGVI
jgi:enoyl-CoA hydratase/carnithine racemase